MKSVSRFDDTLLINFDIPKNNEFFSFHYYFIFKEVATDNNQSLIFDSTVFSSFFNISQFLDGSFVASYMFFSETLFLKFNTS